MDSWYGAEEQPPELFTFGQKKENVKRAFFSGKSTRPRCANCQLTHVTDKLHHKLREREFLLQNAKDTDLQFEVNLLVHMMPS
eukprot:4610497-Amphidinium_carterae.1